jgi:hypothetical protein
MPEKQMYVAGTDTLNLQKTTPPKTYDMTIYHKIPQTTDMQMNQCPILYNLANFSYWHKPVIERMSGFRSIKKPVIPPKSTVFPATISVTDTPFLTKMQKR